MGKKIREVMTKDPIQLNSSTPVAEAARRMREANVGAVVVEDAGKLVGIITDRDITVRAVAQDRDPQTTPLSAICSRALTTISPDEDVNSALEIMREKALRRILVVDAEQHALGIVSLGDLALESDSQSVLGRISDAPPNH